MKYLVQLVTKRDQEILYYVVSKVSEKGEVKTSFYKTEDYNRAFLVAKEYFSDLKKLGHEVEVSLDYPFNKRMPETTVNLFPEMKKGIEWEISEYFQDLVLEFLRIVTSYREAKKSCNYNVIFRHIVRKHKLNLFDEQEFLRQIQPIIDEETDESISKSI